MRAKQRLEDVPLVVDVAPLALAIGVEQRAVNAIKPRVLGAQLGDERKDRGAIGPAGPHDEERTVVGGVDNHRDYDPREHDENYEIGGDFEFQLGPGRLKLIGLDRYDRDKYHENLIFIYADGSPNTGGRYAQQSTNREKVARAEYNWKMLRGDWQLSVEGAFNSYDGTAQLFDLDPSGTFVEVPFPAGTGGVTEDRYESILTHSRQLGKNLSLQLGGGVEYSKLQQTGSMGLTRTFWRPK